MPLFKSNPNDTNTGISSRSNSVDQRSGSSPTRKKSLFSSNNRNSPPPQSTTSTTGTSFFHHRRSSSASESSGNSGSGRSGGGFLGMGRHNGIENDPSIRGARQKVADAENAEKQVDQALNEARQRVRVAREHVHLLEREALEDARRAKAKQAEAKLVSKSAKGLGRHGH